MLRPADLPGMRDTLRLMARESSVRGLLGIGPVVSTILCGSALATAAFTLGAAWLGTPVIGLPVGIWLVAGAAFGARAWSKVATRSGWLADAEADAGSAASGTPIPLPAFVSKALGRVNTETQRVLRAKRDLDELSDRVRVSAGRGSDVLRVGYDVSEIDAQLLLEAAAREARESNRRATDRPRQLAIHGVPVEFERAVAGLVSSGPADAQRFDVLLRRGPDEHLHLFVPESRDQQDGAGWADWSRALPVGFPGLFPTRVDTNQADLGTTAISQAGVAALVLRLSIAAGVLGRTGPRASSGIAGLASALGASALGPAGAQIGARRSLPGGMATVDRAMCDLGEALLVLAPRESSGVPAVKIAARVVSAYFAGQQHGELISASRSAFCSAACAMLPDEFELTLRSAAAELAGGQLDACKQALIRGFRQLREQSAEADVDPFSFVLAEARLGSGDRLTLGRICAGVCLAWGTAPAETIDYLREDYLDELRDAGWLSKRESDTQILRDMIIAMERELLSGRAPAMATRRAA
jgi:hypothetical protein